MRIVLLTPGTGSFLCGSCLRDNALARELRALGHDALIAPLYLPFALEDGGAGEGPGEEPVHLGGINVYLQQHLPLLRRLPRWLRDLLDSPRLLRFVARRSNMTGASGLGPMTLSMISGEHGRQRAELERLIDWLRELERPDVVVLSNAMLLGLARRIKEELGCVVLTTLQGEAPFLDSLPEPWRGRAWAELARRARDVDGFLAVSRYTRELMGERMDLDPARVRVVWNGIDASDFTPRERAPDAPPTIAYLARLCHDKGLPVLFDAFLRVRDRVPGARLVAAGVALGEDRQLLDELRARARAAGCAEAVELRVDVSREEKATLLAEADVFSVPATYGESFGLYLLEALASGTPVVQPRHGAFPELLEATGGGLLCEPDDPEALARGLTELLEDRPRARALGAAGRAAVLERFGAARMARDVEEACRMTAAGGAA